MRPKNGSEELKRIELRQRYAFDLRVAGASLIDIVDEVKRQFSDAPPNYDTRQAWDDVEMVLNKIKVNSPDDVGLYRIMMLEQIDRVMITISQMAQAGNLRAVDKFIRLIDQKARLVGAYAPSQVKITDWRSEIIMLIQQRKITDEQVKEYLGEQLYRELVEQRSPALLEAGAIEEGHFEEVAE